MLLRNTFPRRTNSQKDAEKQVWSLDHQHHCHLSEVENPLYLLFNKMPGDMCAHSSLRTTHCPCLILQKTET